MRGATDSLNGEDPVKQVPSGTDAEASIQSPDPWLHLTRLVGNGVRAGKLRGRVLANGGRPSMGCNRRDRCAVTSSNDRDRLALGSEPKSGHARSLQPAASWIPTDASANRSNEPWPGTHTRQLLDGIYAVKCVRIAPNESISHMQNCRGRGAGPALRRSSHPRARQLLCAPATRHG